MHNNRGGAAAAEPLLRRGAHPFTPTAGLVQFPFKSIQLTKTQRENPERKQQIILSLFRNTSCTQKYILQSMAADGAPWPEQGPPEAPVKPPFSRTEQVAAVRD